MVHLLGELIIFILHIITLIFAIIAPFSNDSTLLSFYIMILPFVMSHWIIDMDACVFTFLEMCLFKKSASECYTNKFLKPIYRINNRTGYTYYYIIGIILWLIALYRLVNHRNCIFLFGSDHEEEK